MSRTRHQTDSTVAGVLATGQGVLTDALNGATFTGTTLTTSATPTVEELEAIAGSLALAANLARTDIANIKTELAAVRVKLGV